MVHRGCEHRPPLNPLSPGASTRSRRPHSLTDRPDERDRRESPTLQLDLGQLSGLWWSRREDTLSETIRSCLMPGSQLSPHTENPGAPIEKEHDTQRNIRSKKAYHRESSRLEIFTHAFDQSLRQTGKPIYQSKNTHDTEYQYLQLLHNRKRNFRSVL